MKKIHFTISVIAIWVTSVIAAVWTRNYDFLSYGLLAMVIVGVAHILSD